jgi:hypothetical protein
MAILAFCSALALAPAAYAQGQTTEPPAAAPEGAQAPKPTIQKINIVALQDLTADEQAQVNNATEKASEADLEGLRNSIDANARVKAALQEKGLTAESVIAAAMGSDGTLTLITKKS